MSNLTMTDRQNILAKPVNAWITCLYPNPQASLRLFCFPYAGIGASTYYAWARLLPAEVELYSIQPPGRESRLKERPYVQMRPLVEALTGALAPYLTSPFAFFGHSMGALTCFEVARQVRRQDLPEPVHLFVSAYRAPQVPDLDPPLCHLPDALFVDELQRRYQGIPEAILREKELLDLFLPVLRADLTILETYRYQDEAPLDYPISAFGGDQDRRVSREELAAWREQTHSTFTLKTFPGDHFFLHSARRSLLSALIKDLTRYMGTQNGSKTNGR